MNAWIGWALAAAAIAAGYVGWGWQGVVLGITVTVFWLLLQFSRALRATQQAAQAPRARVANAVAFHAKLERGQRLLDLIRIAGSLGEKTADDPETFRWSDGGGDAVEVVLRGGRLDAWRLLRAAAAAPQPGPAA